MRPWSIRRGTAAVDDADVVEDHCRPLNTAAVDQIGTAATIRITVSHRNSLRIGPDCSLYSADPDLGFMKLKIFLAALLLPSMFALAPGHRVDGDWRAFGRDPGAQRFSPLTQITRLNVANLRQTWAFDTGIKDLQVTPLVIDGVMYVTGGPYTSSRSIRRRESNSGSTTLTPPSADAAWPTGRVTPGRRPGSSPAPATAG